MWTLLNPRVWIGLVLAALLSLSLVTAYRAGASGVRQKWQAEVALQTAQALALSEANRAKEKVLQTKVQKVMVNFENAKKSNVALATRLSDSLRDFDAELALSEARGDALGSTRANGPGAVEYQLLRNCSANLGGLSVQAQRLADKVLGLQNYITSVQP